VLLRLVAVALLVAASARADPRAIDARVRAYVDAGLFSGVVLVSRGDRIVFEARGTISAGVVEGFNNKAKLTTKKAYGFRTYAAIEIALYHQLGNLPEPKFTHCFW